MDGHFYAAVRRTIGSGTPLLVTLDLDGNVSEQMVAAVDVPTVANVSILAGFAFIDSPHNGMAVLVTARGACARSVDSPQP